MFGKTETNSYREKTYGHQMGGDVEDMDEKSKKIKKNIP